MEKDMLTFFRIVDAHTKLLSKPAPLNARELASLRSILQNAGIPTLLDDGELDGTAYNFEANANAIAIARFAALFRDRLDLLAVLEEAQFLGRSIRVTRTARNCDAFLEVSEHIAFSPEIAVKRSQADQVLECLDLDPANSNEIALDALRSKLSNPATYHRFKQHDLENTYEYLTRLSYTDCGEQSPHLAWA
jgi:hypothetical protein